MFGSLVGSRTAAAGDPTRPEPPANFREMQTVHEEFTLLNE